MFFLYMREICKNMILCKFNKKKKMISTKMYVKKFFKFLFDEPRTNTSGNN